MHSPTLNTKGGVDSGVVCGVASQLLQEQGAKTPLKAFSLSFWGGPPFDERKAAEAYAIAYCVVLSAADDRMAKHSGAEFHCLPISPQDIAENFDKAVWHQEHPSWGNGVSKVGRRSF